MPCSELRRWQSLDIAIAYPSWERVKNPASVIVSTTQSARYVHGLLVKKYWLPGEFFSKQSKQRIEPFRIELGFQIPGIRS